jgi:hypothetical protein
MCVCLFCVCSLLCVCVYFVFVACFMYVSCFVFIVCFPVFYDEVQMRFLICDFVVLYSAFLSEQLVTC